MSNCGETLKLGVLSGLGNRAVAGVMTQGRVTTTRMEQWAIRSQVLRKGASLSMDAVHRLNGSGLVTCNDTGKCLA